MGELIQLLLPLSIALTVFAFALATRRGDGFYLLRYPRQLLRSALAFYLMMPLIAIGVAALFELHPALKVALVALAVSPVSPLIPRKEVKAGGRASYATGLLLGTALLAIIAVPVMVQLVGAIFRIDVDVPARVVMPGILVTVVVPIAAATFVRAVAGPHAERIARTTGAVASVILVVAFLPFLFVSFGDVIELIGNGTLLAIIGAVAAGMVAGHLLGGPEPADRTVLALSTVSRHPAVAVAIGTAIAPDLGLVVAGVLLYLIMSSLAATLYVRWSRRDRVVRANAAGGAPIPGAR